LNFWQKPSEKHEKATQKYVMYTHINWTSL
jgi:hypothetical protein